MIPPVCVSSVAVRLFKWAIQKLRTPITRSLLCDGQQRSPHAKRDPLGLWSDRRFRARSPTREGKPMPQKLRQCGARGGTWLRRGAGSSTIRAMSLYRTVPLGAAMTILACGGSAPPDVRPPSQPEASVTSPVGAGATAGESARATQEKRGTSLTDGASVAFRDEFATAEVDTPWNVFGAENGNRELKGGAEGLWIKIADAEKAWDAVGARTAKLKVDGDFDLRGRFYDFAARGNGSAKLIVVDAANPRGEAAYVERIQIDGKNLFKFGGEVNGSLENWGFVVTDVTGADLRIARLGRTLRAYTRPNERSPWNEFAQVQEIPKSMPRIVKFGVKLSAEAHKSAQVRWVELTLNGQVIRNE